MILYFLSPIVIYPTALPRSAQDFLPTMKD